MSDEPEPEDEKCQPFLSARLRELREKATKGPWEHRYEQHEAFGEETMIHAPNEKAGPERVVVGTVWHDGINLAIRDEDAALIVTLVNHLDEIIGALERE